MEIDLFNINKFNIIENNENYYFFRALNMADNRDIEQEITVSKSGKIERIRTDRERYEDKAKYNENSELSLEEIYDHIKMHYRKDTNCISLTSNANVAINYGRGSYKDKYVMIKIPKNEFGKNVVVAGQYMLQELYFKIEQTLEKLPEEKRIQILEKFSNIDNATETKALQDIIATRYTAKKEEINPNKAHPRKGIKYSSAKAKISSYQSLSEKQLLEVNRVYAKFAILENERALGHVIPHSSNTKLRETIGNAFSSLEVIHYGEIKQENIIEISKESIDIFALIQQIDGINKTKIEELKRELINSVQRGVQISKIPEINAKLRDNISIEEMYELTEGKVEYGKANSIVKNMFYLSKSRQNAIELSQVLKQVIGNNSNFEDIIQYIQENGFRIEPEIISRQSGKGIKLSESVNLNLQKEEQVLVDEIKKLSSDELKIVLENGGLYNAQNIITRTFNSVKENEIIDKSRYYAEAIISQYNWPKIGIEEFKIPERNELIKRLQDKNCLEIYESLKKIGIEENKIPTILLNIATRQGFYEQYKQGKLDELLETRKNILQNDINIELVERFLGYYDIENTEIRLKDYQQRAFNNVNDIFENHKFAQVILPTGAGKSFVALAQMQQYIATHPNEKMLYLAPQDEILNQTKNYIIKYIHGKQGTVGKTEEEIIAEIFPNITFETYTGLLAKRGQEVLKEQYGMIVLDELHRTGAKEWEYKIDALLKNQNKDVKVLGITATPIRDFDGRNMAEETAKKLGYTDEEVKQGKQLASNISLENAIRMGYVVNPKLVYCKYDLISSGKMDDLKVEIEDIEDENQKNIKLQEYNELRKKLNKEIDEEIGIEARKKLEEEARKNINSGIGKEKILKQNIKKGGKYIVFIPVTDQGDIEDEAGNRIGTKTGEDKIKAYQEYIEKVFQKTEIVPQLHSLLSGYSKEKNKEELENFESDNSDKTKFMVVMNKANEGLHIDGIDGIIWFRALDENSRILYLQQLGRAIYPLDENDPLLEDKRPIVIDLTNNSLNVKIEKEFENSEPTDDLEALKIVMEWMEQHDGTIPNKESSNKQEQHYYAILRKIQSKYSKYLEGFDNFKDLTDEDKTRYQEIINLASEIELWDMELPPIPKIRGDKKEFNPFLVEGVLSNFVRLEDEIDKQISKGQLLKNILKIENWCQTNYGDKEIWERKLPSQKSKEEEEKRLGISLCGIRTKMRLKQYEGKNLEEVENLEDRKTLQILRNLDEEYGKSQSLKNVLEIENWCKTNYGDKEIWEKRLPSAYSNNEEEKRLGQAWGSIRTKLKQYEGKDFEEAENMEDRKILEIVKKLNEEYGKSISLKNILEIENWCKTNYGDKEIWEKRLPSAYSNNEEEKRLGQAWGSIRTKLKQYEGKDFEEAENMEDRKILEIVKKLNEEYGKSISLKNILEIENWCKTNYGDKEIWKKRLPSQTSKEEEEKRLGRNLSGIRTRMRLKQYEEKDGEEVVKLLKNLDEEYGKSVVLKRVLEIENWCKTNYGDKEICERKLPSTYSNNEEEKRLASSLRNIRTKLKKYEGKEPEEIENIEDREVLEMVRNLDEKYNPKKALLQQAKATRDKAKYQNNEARKLEQQVSEQLMKRGKTYDEK